MKAIVTVKLKRPWIHHNPRNKQTGKCPLFNIQNEFGSLAPYPLGICTDVTGSHHCYIETGKDIDEIEEKANSILTTLYKRGLIIDGHITRVEVIHYA